MPRTRGVAAKEAEDAQQEAECPVSELLRATVKRGGRGWDEAELLGKKLAYVFEDSGAGSSDLPAYCLMFQLPTNKCVQVPLAGNIDQALDASSLEFRFDVPAAGCDGIAARYTVAFRKKASMREFEEQFWRHYNLNRGMRGSEAGMTKPEWIEATGAAEPDAAFGQQHSTYIGEGIRGLVTGSTNNRGFVLRHKSISVVQVYESGMYALTNALGNLTLGSAKEACAPKQGILTNKEANLNVLMDEPKTVCQVDLTREKVVNMWRPEVNSSAQSLVAIAGNTKCAQTSDDATFLGLGPHSIIRFDPRIKGGEAGVLVPAAPAADGKGAYKFWDSGPAFTCVVTSGRGYIAAGCEDGSIKLFGSAADDYCYFNSNARSVVEGLGAKITAIDISYDAEYIVATTDKFVMVVKTTFQKDNKATNAFVTRAPRKTLTPWLLRLSTKDTDNVGDDANFADARFIWNYNAVDSKERHIVAGCGNNTVMWNFRQVKTAKPSSIFKGMYAIDSAYRLTKRPGPIVASTCRLDRFASGQPQDHVAATADTLHHGAGGTAVKEEVKSEGARAA